VMTKRSCGLFLDLVFVVVVHAYTY
jgi:hypothetical protein